MTGVLPHIRTLFLDGTGSTPHRLIGISSALASAFNRQHLERGCRRGARQRNVQKGAAVLSTSRSFPRRPSWGRNPLVGADVHPVAREECHRAAAAGVTALRVCPRGRKAGVLQATERQVARWA